MIPTGNAHLTAMLRYLFPLLLIASSSFGQDIAITKAGDTLTGKIIGIIQSGTGVAEWLSFKVGENEMPTRFPMSDLVSYRNSGTWFSVAHLLGNVPPIVKPERGNFLRKASSGLGIAGGFFAAGGLTIIASRVLAEEGTLTSSVPFYVGYGFLMAGGIATIGAAVSLSNASKSMDKVKVSVGGVQVN
jgi:hypothetical protein